MREVVSKEQLEKLRSSVALCKDAYKTFRRSHGILMNKADIVMNNVYNCSLEIENFLKELECDSNEPVEEYGFPEVSVGDEVEFENGEKRLILKNNVTLDKDGKTRNWIAQDIMPYKIINHINISGIF